MPPIHRNHIPENVVVALQLVGLYDHMYLLEKSPYQGYDGFIKVDGKPKLVMIFGFGVYQLAGDVRIVSKVPFDGAYENGMGEWCLTI